MSLEDTPRMTRGVEHKDAHVRSLSQRPSTPEGTANTDGFVRGRYAQGRDSPRAE